MGLPGAIDGHRDECGYNEVTQGVILSIVAACRFLSHAC